MLGGRGRLKFCFELRLEFSKPVCRVCVDVGAEARHGGGKATTRLLSCSGEWKDFGPYPRRGGVVALAQASDERELVLSR